MKPLILKQLGIIGLASMALLAAAAENPEARPAPLFKGLGNLQHPITTKSKLAQQYFNQGLILLYNFNHAEAIRSFGGVAQADPDCAMAHWGIAYAYGPNINVPMDEKDAPKAWAALQQALSLRDQADAKDRAYIDALAKRYAEHPPKDRAPLDKAYADAMRTVAKDHPDDVEAQVLFAEALMDMSPWDYWRDDGTMKPNAQEALEVIESVLKRVRQHPGADHLYIHLVEAGPHPEKGVPSAERLGKFAPAAGHLVHMPSHIYLRVGRYHDASTMNELAARADESYLAQCRQQGMYPGGYYPHNVHFLWYSTAMEGRSKDSLAAAKKISVYTKDLRCGAVEGPRQRYLPLLAYARFGRWDAILNEPSPGVEYPFDRAMWHYARGLALAAQGKADEAAQEHAKFAELEGSEAVKAMDNPYFPGTKILAVANEALAGKIAGARSGAENKAVQHLRKAIELEDALPYMEPPYWHQSVRQTLGAVLLKAGKVEEAEQAFRDDLKKSPKNGWSLFGLMEALRQTGDAGELKRVEREFRQAWKHADVTPELAWY
ncbi:MAG: hypothetical protein AB1705_10985 [Verrucomicrobiota bacterium]